MVTSRLLERSSVGISSRRTPKLARVLAVIATVGAGIPIIVSAFSLLGQRYVPMGDEAAILYGIRHVGTADTPLVGVYSTHGWAHPGPILYYLFALPYRLSGGNTVAPFVFAALLNLGCVTLVCYLAWRRRGLLGVVTFGAVTAVLLHGLGPDKLVRIWNPYVPLLLYFAFLLSLWCVAERDFRIRPLAAALACVIIQLHVGYLPLVVGGLVCVTIFLRRSRGRESRTVARRWLAERSTLIIIGLFWLPPLIDLLFRTRNILRLGSYFLSSHAPTAGLSTGFNLLSGHVALTGTWIGGREKPIFPAGQGGIPWQLLVLSSLLAVLAFAHLRKRLPGGAALPIVALGQLAAGGIAASRLEIPIISYLVVWMLPLAAFCWAAATLSGIELALASIPGSTKATQAAVIAAALTTTFVATSRTTAVAVTTPLPQQQYAPAVTAVLHQLDSTLKRGDIVRIEGLGRDFGRPGDGVIYGISQRDPHFYTSDGAAGQKWGTSHRWRGQRISYTLTVVVVEQGRADNATRKCYAAKGQKQIAVWNALSPAEQNEIHALDSARDSAHGQLPLSSARRLEALNGKSFTLAVFMGARVCGT